jgi:DNA-binding NarL/FixJ family response regulator
MHALQDAGMEGSPERAASAIAHGNGLLSYASNSFMQLLQREWPDWEGHALPQDLHACLVRTDASRFDGDVIAVTVARLGQLMFLRACRNDPFRRLTEREALVARLYGDGLAYKAIAKRLDIAPATARVFLQRVYGKLRICDKAQLAALLAKQEG